MLFVLFRHVSDMAKNKEISGQSGAFRFAFVRHGFLKRYKKRYRKRYRKAPGGGMLSGALNINQMAGHHQADS